MVVWVKVHATLWRRHNWVWRLDDVELRNLFVRPINALLELFCLQHLLLRHCLPDLLLVAVEIKERLTVKQLRQQEEAHGYARSDNERESKRDRLDRLHHIEGDEDGQLESRHQMHVTPAQPLILRIPRRILARLHE